VRLEDAALLLLDPDNGPLEDRALCDRRGTPLLYQHEDGSIRVDTPHAVVDVSASELFGVSDEGTDVRVSFLRAGDSPRRPIVGLRLTPQTRGAIAPRGAPIRTFVSGAIEGTGPSGDFRASTVYRDTRGIVVLDGDARELAVLEAPRWTIDGDRLLLKSAGHELTLRAGETALRSLVAGLGHDEAKLVEIETAPVAAGAGLVSLEGDRLVIETSARAELALGRMDPTRLRSTVDEDRVRLHIGDELVIASHAERIEELRRTIAARMGGDLLAELPLEPLLRRYHQLRTDRWLWLLFGPIFLTDRMLDTAENLPREPGEEEDHWHTRRLVAQVFTVAEQIRAVRLRLGAASAVLPYAMLDEEAVWLEKVAGPERAKIEVQALRPKMIGGLRGQVRQATLSMTFALIDVERAATRLEPVTHPQDQSGTHVWGRVGLGAAMLLLSPISGAITLAGAATSKLTDHIAKNAQEKYLVERFGPECRGTWELLVNITGLAAVEMQSYLHLVWADVGRRDREMITAGVCDEERYRAIVLERVRELSTLQQTALPVQGLAIADLCAAMKERMIAGPTALVRGLSDTEVGMKEVGMKE
jgi:hypothetical protein